MGHQLELRKKKKKDGDAQHPQPHILYFLQVVVVSGLIQEESA